MRDLLAITKALADENRLRALALLEGRELCLCQIVEVLGLAPSTTSRHMAILHQARLVESRKQGRWAYFRLAETASGASTKKSDAAPAEADAALALVLASLKPSPQGKTDQKRLKQVLKLEPEELCRQQACRSCEAT